MTEHWLDSDHLRVLAEQRMMESSELSSRSEESREIELYKLELEIQNEELRRLTMELEEARERSLDLFDRAPVAYLTLDAEGRIQRANHALTELFEVDREELLGRPLSAMLTEGDADLFHLHLRSLSPSKGRTECELRVVIDARIVPVRLLSLPLLTPDGIEIRCAVLGRLAPETPVESLPPTVLLIDVECASRDFVQRTLEGEGYRVLTSTGPDALVLFERERVDCVLLDVRMPSMSGFELCSQIRTLPGGADLPIVFLTALREIGAFERAISCGAADFLTKPVRPAELLLRVEAALKLRHLNAERDELYTLLRQQRDDMIRAELQKERMSTFLIHDLKNPTSGIWMASGLAQRDPGASERSREIAERIQRDAETLLRMFEGLMDIARADEGVLTVSQDWLDLRALVGDLTTALSIPAQMRTVSLRSVLGVEMVFADRDLLRRILENLLDNAIRHAPPGSTVTLDAATRGNGVEIRVMDAGPGVPPELREAIFERFFQGPRGSRGGRGLGLAFCRLAAEAHGGQIWVESSADGAVFCLWLPATPAASTSTEEGKRCWSEHSWQGAPHPQATQS